MPSKRKRTKKAVAALGAVGMSMSVAGAVAGPIGDTPSPAPAQGHRITLNEEEIADVSLGTFYIFDKEPCGSPRLGDHYARASRHNASTACRHCRGCRACRGTTTAR
jgi:hypothetical protein